MEVSKFKIGSDIIDIKDAQARDDVVAAMNAAQDAQSTADLKQDAASAWKIARTTANFSDVTIAANGGGYNFNIPIPSGASNARPLYARNTDGTPPLVTTNMYTSSGSFIIRLNNITTTSLTLDNITVEVTYAYQ